MCGIAGQISWGSLINPNSLDLLVAGLRHRGPDDQGTWLSPDGVCSLGHVRLSVIDLSPAGHQPMLDTRSGNVIVFNGEIYNFQLLRAECERLGYQFKSHTDTEVILALYSYYGDQCITKLRGMFAFAIWDQQQQRLLMARDRIGKKPLNYAITPSGLVFSSEIHPLSQHPLISKEMDEEALEFFLQLQYIPAPWTIYRQIRKLPPSHYAVLTQNSFKLHQYWDVDYTKKIKITEQDALVALEEKITESVKLRMVADVPVGAFLSGGVDSSVVTATMSKLKPSPIKTFSIGFAEKQYDELQYAQEAATICNTHHHPTILNANFESELPEIVKRYGEPYGDQSAIPSFAVCREARKQVTVVMNGDGGDELLGGYPRYALSNSRITSASLIGSLLHNRKKDPISIHLPNQHRLLGRLARGWVRSLQPEAASFLMYSAFWNDADRISLLGKQSLTLSDWRTKWMSETYAHANNPIDRMLWLDSRTYLPGDLMAKMDIASMHCGLETRSPLLDHELIEFCASLPVGLKVKNGTGKYLLKRLAEKYYSPEFVYRPKMGFGIPQTEWLRGPLKPLVEHMLGNVNFIEPLNFTVVQQTLTEFMQGDNNHSQRIWTVFMYSLWAKYCN